MRNFRKQQMKKENKKKVADRLRRNEIVSKLFKHAQNLNYIFFCRYLKLKNPKTFDPGLGQNHFTGFFSLYRSLQKRFIPYFTIEHVAVGEVHPTLPEKVSIVTRKGDSIMRDFTKLTNYERSQYFRSLKKVA